MIKCRVIGKNNNAYYEVSDGAVFVENYNETLDSGTILLQQLPSEIDIEPYDLVEISTVYLESKIEMNRRFLCVDNYIETQTSLNPPIYKYEIDLFSPTKLLEGMLCPNLAITKNEGIVRSVKDYIKQYVDLFCEKTAYDIAEQTATNLILVDSDYWNDSNIFDMECPEMQWNEPTLREVLNDLMMVADCIPVVKYDLIDGYYLDYLKLSENKGEINATQLEGINYIQKMQSSDDYVSDLKMHLVNSANNSKIVDNVIPKDTTNIVERIGFRNDESYLLTSENIRLQTSFPIWQLFKCIISIRANVYIVCTDGTILTPTGSNALKTDIDITDYIFEYSKWVAKDVYYGAWTLSDISLDTDYRNRTLYYNRGQKNILNFDTKAQNNWLFTATYTFFDMLYNTQETLDAFTPVARAYVETNYPSKTFDRVDDVQGITNEWKQAEFLVDYEAMDDFVFSASKSPLPKHKRVVVDNQTNSYIDINRQGILEYLKAKRLGNKLSLVNARYIGYNENQTPDLAETINGKIIFKKEIEVYNDYINANYMTVENYVLKDYFTGVKSKLRSWRVVSGAEATTRAELIKLYVNEELNSLGQRKIPDVEDAYYKIPSYNFEHLSYYLDNFKYCAIRFKDSNNTEIPSITTFYDDETPIVMQTNAIQVEFTKHLTGKSLIFTINMQDNFYCGNYISSFKGHETGHTEQKGIKYTDDNGEVVSGIICFYNDIIYNKPNETLSNYDIWKALKPLVNAGSATYGSNGIILNSEDMVFKFPFTIHKDNKEILQISVQFEFNDEANDMFIGFNKNNSE